MQWHLRWLGNLCRKVTSFAFYKYPSTFTGRIACIYQGIEHSGGASFAKNPIYFDPENIIKLAIEGGCNAVATTYGGLVMLSRKYAHKIPFIVKIK